MGAGQRWSAGRKACDSVMPLQVRRVDPTRNRPLFEQLLRGSIGQGRHRLAATAFVSVSVSVVIIRRRSPASSCPPIHAQRTPANGPEQASADMQSGLGSRPHEFESRILRHADQARCCECRRVSLSPEEPRPQFWSQLAFGDPFCSAQSKQPTWAATVRLIGSVTCW